MRPPATADLYASLIFRTGNSHHFHGRVLVLAMIALLIGYEGIERLMDPVPISFNQAIPITVVGVGVNLISAWSFGI